MGAQAGGAIFISYRRDDDPGYTLALYQQLENAFSAGQIFMDVEGDIHAGEDFTRVLTERVGQCGIMLAVIGPRWVALMRERAAAPNDFLQIEIEAALRLGKPVIPVLVNGAAMPGPGELPEKLQDLWRFNAFRLRHESFRADCEGLVKEISALLEGKERPKLPSRIDRVEELTNWAIIKDSRDPADFRDHLARFPGGEIAKPARLKLEQIVWASIIVKRSVKAMRSYLVEFPDGAHARDAWRYINGTRIRLLAAVAILLVITASIPQAAQLIAALYNPVLVTLALWAISITVISRFRLTKFWTAIATTALALNNFILVSWSSSGFYYSDREIRINRATGAFFIAWVISIFITYRFHLTKVTAVIATTVFALIYLLIFFIFF